MHRRLSDRGGRWQFAAVAMLACGLGPGCTLVPPGCRNRSVTAAIEQEARESVERWTKTSAPTPADTRVALADQLELDRHDNTRACSGNIVVGQGQEEVKLPIEYQVIAGADGQPYYQWDKDEFDKAIIGSALASAFEEGARADATRKEQFHAEQQPDAPAGEDPPSLTPPPPADPLPLSSAAPLDFPETWKRDVSAELFRRAKALTDIPHGTQTMRFRIGPDGEITIAKAVPPIENTALADKLVDFLDASDHVAKPPFGRVSWVKVTFRF